MGNSTQLKVACCCDVAAAQHLHLPFTWLASHVLRTSKAPAHRRLSAIAMCRQQELAKLQQQVQASGQQQQQQQQQQQRQAGQSAQQQADVLRRYKELALQVGLMGSKSNLGTAHAHLPNAVNVQFALLITGSPA